MRVLEDREAQVVIPRLKNDIVEVFEACVDGRLDEIDLQFEDNAAVCVVLASDGYPVSYEKGYPIKGLDTFKEGRLLCVPRRNCLQKTVKSLQTEAVCWE